jgi:vitamin B12 transporter
MNKTAIASLIGLLFSPSIFAAETINTDDVVVTASRISQPRESVIADVTVIDREEIERAGQSTFVELLQAQPGIEISSSGGAGKTSHIFMRGTNADQVVVLVDGMRINSATQGTTVFENIPLAQIEKIEILRGPATSLYGQDAIGGVIQIFTKKGGGQPTFNAAVGYGSYDTKTAEAGLRGSIADTSYSLNVSSFDTQGFSALKTKNPNLKDNDGYRNLAFSGSVTHKITEGHDIGLQFFSSEGHTNFDSSSNLISGGDPSFSDNANLSQFSYSATSHNQFTANWLSTLRLGEGVDENENFSQVNPYNPVSRSLFKTYQRQYSWQNDINLPLGTLTLLYDRLEQRVSSTTTYDKKARDNDGFVASYLVNSGAHSLQASYRSDHNSQFGTNDTGSIGYGYSFSPNWHATTSYGTAFKAPTFNELYFPGFGNPALKPEKSRNAEASLRYEDLATSASLTLYENKIRDLINFVETAPSTFVPLNVDKVTIQGLTLAASQRWDNWQLRGSIDIQSPRDTEANNLLDHRANRHANMNLSREWGDWRLGSELIATSVRYDDAANTDKLSGYALLNLTADYKITQDWKLQARVNNLFDKDYTLATDGSFAYNTPGTNLFVGVRYSPAN